MLPIKKTRQPIELENAVRNIKITPNAQLTWNNIDGETKHAVMRSLLKEQGGLCAYCMRRITSASGTVEHYIPQSRGKGTDDENSVDYKNLLAGCDGFSGSAAELTCDKARGDAPLTVNPLKPETLTSIRYSRDGRILSDNASVNHDLNDVLNLNQRLLVRNRAKVILEMSHRFQRLAQRKGDKAIGSFCEKYVKEHENNPSKRQEYDGVLIYFMKKRARRSA